MKKLFLVWSLFYFCVAYATHLNETDFLIRNMSKKNWTIEDTNSLHGNLYFFYCNEKDSSQCRHDANVYCSIRNNGETCLIPPKALIGVQFTTTRGLAEHCIEFIDSNSVNKANENGGNCDNSNGYRFTNDDGGDFDAKDNATLNFNNTEYFFNNEDSNKVEKILKDNW